MASPLSSPRVAKGPELGSPGFTGSFLRSPRKGATAQAGCASPVGGSTSSTPTVAAGSLLSFACFNAGQVEGGSGGDVGGRADSPKSEVKAAGPAFGSAPVKQASPSPKGRLRPNSPFGASPGRSDASSSWKARPEVTVNRGEIEALCTDMCDMLRRLEALLL